MGAESILRGLEAGDEAVSLGPAERFQPNKALHLTARSLRSYVATASGSR
jgi:hypothetical protein